MEKNNNYFFYDDDSKLINLVDWFIEILIGGRNNLAFQLLTKNNMFQTNALFLMKKLKFEYHKKFIMNIFWISFW